MIIFGNALPQPQGRPNIAELEEGAMQRLTAGLTRDLIYLSAIALVCFAALRLIG